VYHNYITGMYDENKFKSGSHSVKQRLKHKW